MCTSTVYLIVLQANLPSKLWLHSSLEGNIWSWQQHKKDRQKIENSEENKFSEGDETSGNLKMTWSPHQYDPWDGK